MTIVSTTAMPTEMPEIRGGILGYKRTTTVVDAGQIKHRPGDICPANQAIGRKCNKKGHYATCCFSKTAAASAHEVEAEDPAFLGALINSSDNSWTSNLRIAGKRIQFKLNPGAGVTVISETTYTKSWTISHYRNRPDLQ